MQIDPLHFQIGADVGGEIVNTSDEDEDDGYSDDYDSDEDGESLDSDEESDDILEEEYQDHGVDDTKVNLDITAMIAYVSAMTNGRYVCLHINKYCFSNIFYYQVSVPVSRENPERAGGVGEREAGEGKPGADVRVPAAGVLLLSCYIQLSQLSCCRCAASQP